MTTETIPAVLRTVEVSVAPERAFEIFTRRMSDWWPLQMYSISEEKAVGVRFEEEVGGRVFEVAEDGTEWEWAEVLVWDAPHRLVMAWHPTKEHTVSTEVEVRFISAEGGTRVVLEHRGWEQLGERAAEAHTDYEQGWQPVLGLFQAAAGS